MGIGILSGSGDWPVDPPPNPDPKRWELLQAAVYQNAYVLKVKYLDCSNFEGIKIMVYAGKFPYLSFASFKASRASLDPHFSETEESPIARFRPDKNGWDLATTFAMNL